MEHSLLSRAAEFIKQQRQKKRWQKGVTAMAAVVVFCTTYALILPAITLTDPVYCGQEEHTHGADCYGQVLTCGLPEAKAHTHTDACYHIERTLICSLAEEAGHTHTGDCEQTETHLTCTSTEEGHEHGEGCYTTTTTTVCGQTEHPGHSHTEACWQETRTLLCTESTEVPEGAHVHDDSCYGTGEEPTCGQEEHQHEDACHANPKADVETAAQWERTFQHVDLTGEYPADVLAIAETQLGYTESSRNYIINDQGRKLGYSRYGAWYGDPYGDWCAMFVSFCLHYAQIPADDFPREASCQRWIEELTRRDLYRTAGTYTPKAGDLIFFNWDGEPDSDHVGLVKEVILDEAGDPVQLETIEGNCSNQVKTRTYALEDSSILGFGELPQGKVPEAPAETEEPPATPEPVEPESPQQPEVREEEPVDNGFVSLDSLMEQVRGADISNGPVVFIFAQDKADVPAAFSTRETRSRGVMMFAARNTSVTNLKDVAGISLFFTLTDTDNRELPKDASGNYIVTGGTTYKLTLTINAPDGFVPGTYQYQMPKDLSITGGSGYFTIGTERVGEWVVGDDGLMTLVFYENMDDKTEVTVSAIMGAVFHGIDSTIDFDGKITVVVTPPPASTEPTLLEKWSDENESGPNGIEWTIHMVGNEDSNIVGSTITDTLGTENQRYTDADLAGGLSFTAAEPTGGEPIWHNWVIPFSYVTWNEDKTSWSYQMPEMVYCADCHRQVVLGDDDWEYWIRYTTTPDVATALGGNNYVNRVMFEGQEKEAWTTIVPGESTVEVVKTGSLRDGADGGKFVWDLRVTIPGRQAGQPTTYQWFITDMMGINNDQYQTVARVNNDIDLARVTATWNGQTFTVPEIEDATENDPFAWNISWSGEENGVKHLRNVEILHRCACTEETCGNWHDACWGMYSYTSSTGAWVGSPYCHCWDVEGDITFTFSYETDDPEIISQHGGKNRILWNNALLYNKPVIGGEAPDYVLQDSDDAHVTIPGVFRKELAQDYDGYTAHYTITVNEAKLDLTRNSFTIRDEMSATLSYISGTLVITTEDAYGNRGTLVQGEDYTVVYDGTGTDFHVLTIEVLKPAPVKYILDYDTTVIIPSNPNQPIKYSNEATVTLWGKDLHSDSVEKIFADINISAEAYKISVQKQDASGGKALPGATFGLFTARGGLIDSGTTDANGHLTFETSVTQGIILREHIPYYIQEIKAPAGYYLDGTKHWFCFCDQGENCETCAQNAVGDYPGIDRVSSGYTYTLTNQAGTYELPETGGVAPHWYILGGILLSLGGTLWYRKEHMGKKGETS